MKCFYVSATPSRGFTVVSGKAIGGSSTTDLLIYERGNKYDYERIAQLGNPDWCYRNVLPYLRKLENCSVETQDAEYRGHFGPVSVEDLSFRTNSSEVFVRACNEKGFKFIDPNGKSNVGVSYVQARSRRGLRVSAEKAYLRPIKCRKNLKVIKCSTVWNLIFDKRFPQKVVGVKYESEGKFYLAVANWEVIIANGGINTPKLLLLSGIGPAEHLRNLRIPLRMNLPVGQKLTNRLMFYGE